MFEGIAYRTMRVLFVHVNATGLLPGNTFSMPFAGRGFAKVVQPKLFTNTRFPFSFYKSPSKC
jgi:hypothetical protein